MKSKFLIKWQSLEEHIALFQTLWSFGVTHTKKRALDLPLELHLHSKVEGLLVRVPNSFLKSLMPEWAQTKNMAVWNTCLSQMPPMPGPGYLPWNLCKWKRRPNRTLRGSTLNANSESWRHPHWGCKMDWVHGRYCTKNRCEFWYVGPEIMLEK